jgi:26S proteasome regulatory subunit N10
MSMEEEQARQAAVAQSTAAPVPEPSTPKAVLPAPAPETVPADPTDEEEAAMLREALAMSEADDVPMEEGGGDDDDDEEEAIQRAIAMSMQKEDKEKKP